MDGVELEWREAEIVGAGRPVMVSADEVDRASGERRDGGAERTESSVRGGGGGGGET